MNTNEVPADFTGPFGPSYLALLGMQATGLADGTELPADVEASLEGSIRLTAMLIKPLNEIQRQCAALEEQRAAVGLSEAEREHARWLQTKIAEIAQIFRTHADQVISLARHYGVYPPP